MQQFDAIPLFKTRPATIQPPSAGPVLATVTAQRPPLPRDLWQTGIATLAEARDAQRALSPDYVTACGLGEDGLWYVACPSSGLTVKAATNA